MEEFDFLLGPNLGLVLVFGFLSAGDGGGIADAHGGLSFAFLLSRGRVTVKSMASIRLAMVCFLGD